MRVRILTSALIDLAKGREFYGKQGEGAGSYFFDSVFLDMDSLVIYGGIHANVLGFHRLSARRFPYAIYYNKDADGAVVDYRVLDCRQAPAKINTALKSGK